MENRPPKERRRKPKEAPISFRPVDSVRELLDAAREADEDVSAIINTTLDEYGRSVATRLAQERFRRKLRFQKFLQEPPVQ